MSAENEKLVAAKNNEGMPIPAPQHYNSTTGKYEYATGKNGASHVSDVDVLARLNAVEAKIQAMSEKLQKNHVGTGVKPTTNINKGDSYLDLNNGDTYIWDGTKWELI